MGALEATPFENLPLGFRFKPTDVELIDHYLRLKINGNENEVACIKEVDICKVEPWDLPDLSAIKTNDCEWFFFCPRDRKYPTGQRSNRATEAGYWKATGKDRTIKSRKLGLIGMKKTLVFYTGRAPKGQRTCWVIHEYRTTLKELDGSHPGQGPFVLCRLFKKPDELKPDDNDDGSHADEVETNICSPNPTNITHEDVRSEPAVVQASPASVEQSVEQRMMFDNSIVKTSDSLTSETVFPHYPRMNEEMTPGVDSNVTGGILFDEDSSDLCIKWQDRPVDMAEIFPPEIGDGYNRLKLQDTNGERDPISDFLDSVIMNPDAPVYNEAARQGAPIVGSDIWNYSSIKESRSCSGSDVEVVQQQPNVNYNEPKGNSELLPYNPLADDDDIFSDAAVDRFCLEQSIFYSQPLPASISDAEGIVGNSGISIRSDIIRSRQMPSENFMAQGMAPRRIHFQMVQDKGSKPTVIEEPTIPPYEDFLCLEDLSEEDTTKCDENESNVNSTHETGIGIKIRTDLQRSQPSASQVVEQGIAYRRMRLRKVSSAEITKLSQEISDDSDSEYDIKPVLLKRPTSPIRMVVKVVMVVFLFVACFGLWIARNVILLSS